MSEIEQREIFMKNLNRIMQELALKQADVAKAIGVTPQSFNAWMQGKTIPRMGKVQALADYFHVSKAELIEEHSANPDAGRNAILQRAAEDPGKRTLFDLVAKADEKETELAVQFMKALIEK